jgi:hypothetical protein
MGARARWRVWVGAAGYALAAAAAIGMKMTGRGSSEQRPAARASAPAVERAAPETPGVWRQSAGAPVKKERGGAGV